MAITQSVCNSFKSEVLKGLHNFSASGGNTFKIALYTSDATLDSSTTVYSTTSGGVGFADFSNSAWTSASFTVRGALIYNSTNGNRAVAVLDFGIDKEVSSGTFTVEFPTADSQNAIVRVK